jgi:hypothetical protein
MCQKDVPSVSHECFMCVPRVSQVCPNCVLSVSRVCPTDVRAMSVCPNPFFCEMSIFCILNRVFYCYPCNCGNRQTLYINQVTQIIICAISRAEYFCPIYYNIIWTGLKQKFCLESTWQDLFSVLCGKVCVTCSEVVFECDSAYESPFDSVNDLLHNVSRDIILA